MNFLGTPLPYFQNPIFKIIDRVTNLLYSLLKLATAMLKWFQTLDKDQKATIVSSAIIICLTVFASFFLSVKKLLLIFPLQFLITYFLFCTTNIKRLDHWYIDQNSNKQWLVSCSSTFPGITIILITLFAVIAVANPSKFFATFALLCPLLITRTVIFLRKLPLIALYADLLPKKTSSTNFVDRTGPNSKSPPPITHN